MPQAAAGRAKALFVLPASVMGGAEVWAYNLLGAIRAFRPVLLVQSSIGDAYAPLGISVHYFDDYGCRSPYLYSVANVVSYARAIRAVANRENPDVIFGLMHNGTVFVTAAALSMWRRRQVFLGSILGNVSAFFASGGRSPSIYERTLLRHCFRRLAGIVTPSKGVRLDLVENFQAPAGRVTTIYNGFDLDSHLDRSKAPVALHKNCSWVVSACRLSAEKDFETLLRAFRIVRNVCHAKLLILGEGMLRDDILALARELELGNDLVLLGYQSNPFPYMAMADVFVLSSHHEGFGNVIVEAMSVGTPVVSSDCPSGPREIITDRENGFLVPMKDPESMADRCLRVIQNPGLRDSMSHQATLRSRDFSIECMGRQFDDYLNRIIQAR